MKTNYFKLLTLLMVIVALIGSCKKDENTDPDDNNNNDPTDVIKAYSGSGSKGDLITFSINQTNKTYSVHNETTGNDDNGTYTVKTGDLNNIYEVTASGETFFAVELSDKIIAANFPTGNSENDISFGVSSSLSYLNNSANIIGDYTWIIMTNDEIDGSTANKVWGVMTVNSDGTWIKKNYKGGSGFSSNTGYLAPNDFSETLPLTSGDEQGTWEVNGTHEERLNVTINGVVGTLTGYVYGDANSSAFLLDLGTGNGFLLGVKNTNTNISNIAGTYSFIDVARDGSKGAGNYVISSTGNVSWNHITTEGTGVDSGTFDFTQCPNLKNVYYCEGDEKLGNIYGVICGDIIIHFLFKKDDGSFSSYGAGGKI